MNLAGPGTGLMMMTPQNVLTSNFFSEAGYYTNGIFHVKTATELLKTEQSQSRPTSRSQGRSNLPRFFDELPMGR